MPSLDVLIPTFNRPAALAVTLTSLCSQTRRAPGGVPFRVVVSDQSEVPVEASGEVRAVLAVLRAQGHGVELLRHVPRLGLAEQRSFLLERCRADHALFLDDDLLLEPWVIEQMTRTLEREGSARASQRRERLACPARPRSLAPAGRPRLQGRVGGRLRPLRREHAASRRRLRHLDRAAPRALRRGCARAAAGDGSLRWLWRASERGLSPRAADYVPNRKVDAPRVLGHAIAQDVAWTSRG